MKMIVGSFLPHSIALNTFLSSFLTKTTLFFIFFNPMSRLNFLIGQKDSFSFYNVAIYKRQVHLISNFACFNQVFSNFFLKLFSSSHIYKYSISNIYIIWKNQMSKWRLKFCKCIYCLEMITIPYPAPPPQKRQENA